MSNSFFRQSLVKSFLKGYFGQMNQEQMAQFFFLDYQVRKEIKSFFFIKETMTTDNLQSHGM